MNKAERRRKLFKLYATNLSVFRSDFPGCFACPICSRVFSPSACDLPLGVDLAHVYPGRVGRNVCVLTCVECNNRMGRHYDHHVTTAHKVLNALTPGSTGTIDAMLTVAGAKMGVEASWNKSLVFKQIAKQTNPAAIEAFEQMAREGSIKFDMTYGWIDPRRACVSTLHSAYLTLFFNFGYEYMAFSDTAWLREILASPTPPANVPLMSMPVALGTPGVTKERVMSAGVTVVNGRLKVVAALLPHNDPKNIGLLVFLPGLGEDGKADYEELTRFGSGRKELTLHLQRVSTPDWLGEKQSSTRLSQSWENTKRAGS